MRAGEERVTRGDAGKRHVIYCLIPPDLAPKLHDLLRAHFRDDPNVEVVVEQRRRERRSGEDRREAEGKPPAGRDRRRVRSAGGRRAGERRAPLIAVEAPELPRRARRYASQLTFVERLEPSTQEAEDLDTTRLVTRFQAGDQAAFPVLYLRYFDRVYGYLRIALRDVHEAEDAAQEVFTRVFEALPSYERRRQPFRSWLFRVVRNYTISQLRKSGRTLVAGPEELERLQNDRIEARVEEPGFESLGWLADADLLLFIERLPSVQRQVLVLSYLLELKTGEIAEILGRTPDDVRLLRSRALRFLRSRLTAVGRVPRRPGRRAPAYRRKRQIGVLRARRFALWG